MKLWTPLRPTDLSVYTQQRANVEAVQKGPLARGLPSAYCVIKGITHYRICREGFKEATDLELAWFDKHLKARMAKRAYVP